MMIKILILIPFLFMTSCAFSEKQVNYFKSAKEASLLGTYVCFGIAKPYEIHGNYCLIHIRDKLLEQSY